jgi:hypothetical protein
MCNYLRIYRKSVGEARGWDWIGGGKVNDVCVDGTEKGKEVGREGARLALSHRYARRLLG